MIITSPRDFSVCLLSRGLGHSHYILCSTNPDKGFSGLSEEIKKSHLGKKLFNYSIEQTSLKIDCTDHVSCSDDSVFSAWYMTCNNLQFIVLTFSSLFLGFSSDNVLQT